MKKITKCFLLLSLIFVSISQMHAQETEAQLSGSVINEKGVPAGLTNIVAKYEPTNALHTTVANSRGVFSFTNLRSGGPYSISVSGNGIETKVFSDVYLSLGNNPAISIFVNSVGANTEVKLNEVTITSSRRRAVNGINVGREQINVLPTLGRSLSDVTRLTPQSNNNSFAGSSFRYNNITLDGAVNNDAIGFSNSAGGTSGGGQSGTAGAGTGTSPYSLDCIQDVQVLLAPYDVKLGNFTGGSVNAVTKSGSNQMHGSAYVYGRNQDFVGKSIDGLKTKLGSEFYDYQAGVSIGGPIIKDKLFYFVNGEMTRRQIPTFLNAGDPGAAIDLNTANLVRDHLILKGYDPGTFGAYNIKTKSDKFFGKIDYKINDNNSLMIRAIYTDGQGQNLEHSSSNFQFSNTDFTQHTKNTNVVGEFKSKLNDNLDNVAIGSFIDVKEYRETPGKLAPFISINSDQIWAGTWREASVYNMKQRTFEFTDYLTYKRGIHKFTIGTHNEFYKIHYGFINSWNGRWEYSSVANFLADMPSRVRGSYALDPTQNNANAIADNPAADFNVNLLSFYVQDELSPLSNLKITGGVRVDYPFVGHQPPTDPAVSTTLDYISTTNPTFDKTNYSALTNKWMGKATVSPRFGFNYDVFGNQNFIVRGGSGMFVGRMPFAWLGYAYTLTGNTYGTIDYKPSSGTVVPIAIDPSNLQSSVPASARATREVDLVDNNFHLPTIWRSDLNFDFKFGNGYNFTIGGMYTKTLYDVKFEQINYKDQTAYFASGPTLTPVYTGGKVNTTFSNAYLLSNTNQGYRYNVTAKIGKNFRDQTLGKNSSIRENFSLAYTYGMSKDISNGVRNSFQSNYELNAAITPNNPGLSLSNFDMRHRLVSTAGFNLAWNKSNSSVVSFFFSAQSGSPYTFTYASSPNPFSNSSNANLAYIPKNSADIVFANLVRNDGTIYSAAQQLDDFNSFVDNNSYLKKRRGQYTERNGAHTPWNNVLDMKLQHEFRITTSKNIQISLDVFNVLNLINKDWGKVYFVTNTNNQNVGLLTFAKDAAGKSPGAPSTGYVPTFTFNKPVGGEYYTTDPIASRFQAQLGLKYNF